LAKLTWRKAELSDAATLWRWRNERDTRLASINTARVTLPSHKAWLEKKLSDERCALWIVSLGNKPAAQVRLDGPSVSISLDKSLRGKGLGSQILKDLAPRAKKRGVKKLTAVVKPGNVGSAIAFLKAGFVFAGFDGKLYRLERPLG
jgi:L-amino acid N-acyltransferase YncA